MDISELGRIRTERLNPNSKGIDKRPVEEIVDLIHQEHHDLVKKVDEVKPQIVEAIEIVVGAIKNGKLIYLSGSGTSGRLASLQAAECPPTFSTDPDMIQVLMAGGDCAILVAREGAEDDYGAGYQEARLKIKKGDVAIGVAASGRTPYVVGVIEGAKENYAHTICVTTNPGCELGKQVDVDISVNIRPPLIKGSTRWTPGTVQKMVLDEITSAAMISLGYVYDGYMVALNVRSNEKTYVRALSTMMDLCGVSEEQAVGCLQKSDGNLMASIVMAKRQGGYEAAMKLLDESSRNLRKVIG